MLFPVVGFGFFSPSLLSLNAILFENFLRPSLRNVFMCQQTLSQFYPCRQKPSHQTLWRVASQGGEKKKTCLKVHSLTPVE